jgi:arsenate reductase-like glutaredoxin family protein
VNALAVAEELEVAHDVILYIKTPPDREALEKIEKAQPVDTMSAHGNALGLSMILFW